MYEAYIDLIVYRVIGILQENAWYLIAVAFVIYFLCKRAKAFMSSRLNNEYRYDIKDVQRTQELNEDMTEIRLKQQSRLEEMSRNRRSERKTKK
jgi:hypothetical protein